LLFFSSSCACSYILTKTANSEEKLWKYSSPHEEYSEVKIAKSIGFGSTKEDVVAAFGECEEKNIYESTELGYVTYEYVYDYNQHMRFTIYEEFGVTCIELKNYGA
jgi:hypothetical protein